MIQIQSTWFPVIDRNPQKYVPNIFEAKNTDFIKATQTIYFNARFPTYIELPVMEWLVRGSRFEVWVETMVLKLNADIK